MSEAEAAKEAIVEKKKNFWQEFKEFAFRGNVIDLAIAVIIGAAFSAIVNALVNDIVMPFIGLVTAGKNFNELKGTIHGVTFPYGMFIQAIINFLIIAFTLFVVIKVVNKIQKRPKPEPPGPSEVDLLTEIRDLLANK